MAFQLTINRVVLTVDTNSAISNNLVHFQAHISYAALTSVAACYMIIERLAQGVVIFIIDIGFQCY